MITWKMRGVAVALLCLFAVCLADDAPEKPHVAHPGGAGHALVFHDNVVVKTDFKDFPTDSLTFEAWISTSDFCHTGAILSYAIETETTDLHEKTANYNHFVIFDPKNVLACRGFQYIDIIPDIQRLSCHSHFNKSRFDLSPKTANFVERDGRWHHLAVTWSAKKTDKQDGETIIYMDGMEVARAQSEHHEELQPNGALMLGGEQDCFAGCTDPHQGFYGMMDEVRIWKTVRTQQEIIQNMRLTGGQLDGHPDCVAYWKFDDPGTKSFEMNGIVRDSSGKGNDLDLFTPPRHEEVKIQQGSKALETGALKFKNNYAMNSDLDAMPTQDITVEFWARGGDLGRTKDTATHERYAEFFSFATQSRGDGDVGNDYGLADSAFMDDAIRIERYLTEYNSSDYLTNTDVSTKGAISVHINANRQGNGKHKDNWIDFATKWVDAEWHHIAVTWEYYSGETRLYFDGEEVLPFWRASEGTLDNRDPADGGVENTLAKGIGRSKFGSLVLGQNQECYGGCFSPAAAYDGYLAEVRIWSTVLDGSTIRANMFRSTPAQTNNLALHYSFHRDNIRNGDDDRNIRVRELRGGKDLKLGTIAPSFQYSEAPLTAADGTPLAKPHPGKMGHALKLHDKQVLMLHDFHDFPSNALTVEFWMWSIDTCREGVPFSYAHGEYEETDNAFLIFNYNNWGVSIMEDEGGADDHNAGFGSTDGRWHHIAVTWSSETGEVKLYDNGRPQWVVQRGKGEEIPSGGTLVIGREQDCLGGCFDSAPGAAGDVQEVMDLEYGPQDFFGIIEEVRIWKRVRSDEEVYKSMKFDRDADSGVDNYDISTRDKDLVAWWKFDEGSGFSVKDETGHGHTLRLMEDPDWVVPRWLSSCGDGVLEGGEECDDGNRQNGDGCSRLCEVEPGFVCDAVSPSVCRKYDAAATGGSAPLDWRAEGSGTHSYIGERTSGGTHGSGHSPTKKRKAGSGLMGVFVTILVLLVLAVIVYVVYRKRETIYEYVPAVEDFVHASQARISQVVGGQGNRYNSLSTLDPQVADVSPEFVDSQPPTAYQAPGRPGAYEPFPDRRQ